MAVLTRSNYIPNTLIQSSAVNTDFNQLVDLLSGVSTNKDTLLKYSNATDPVLRVDQLGAGLIQQWLQNGAVKTLIDNSGHLYIGEGVTDATPALGRINATGGSGTNIAGANLELAGGKGTGNAVPGHVAARYSLIGASGTTLQSLSSNFYPFATNMFTHAAIVVVANTASETTLLGAGSAGSTKTIEAGMARAGQIYRITIPVFFTTTGTPTGQLKIKLGGTTIADSAAQTFPTAGMSSRGYIVAELSIEAIGATGAARVEPLAFWFSDAAAATGFNPVRVLTAGGSQTIDFTAAQAIDVTWQWGTASASNSFNAINSNIEIFR